MLTRFAYADFLAAYGFDSAWAYFLATGDWRWLEAYGYPIIHDTADFWASHVTHNKNKDVMGSAAWFQWANRISV